MTRKELAEVMLYLAKNGVAHFCKMVSEETGIPHSAENEQMAWIVEEAIILHLWIISKTLPHEKALLDAVHDCYLEYARSRGMAPEAIEAFQAKVAERYGRYYGAWDDKVGGDQLILAFEIQRCLLDRGKATGRLPSAFLQLGVVTWVLSFMRIILESRSRYEIGETSKQ